MNPSRDLPGGAVSGGVSGELSGAARGISRARWNFFVPTATKPNPAVNNTWTWFSRGNSSYNALQVDVNRRFSQGLSFRGVYTWSKALDDGDTLNGTAANNAPGLVSNPFNLRADWGLATYDVRNMGVVSAVYELPFGRGKALANNLEGLEQQAGERMVGDQHRHRAVGLPVHAAAQLQPVEQRRHAQSGAAVRQSELQRHGDPWSPGPVVQSRRVSRPPPNSGFYGNLGRDTFIGPGLATWDFSTMKNTGISERLKLQFRAEIFNLLNRANFNTPSLIVFT